MKTLLIDDRNQGIFFHELEHFISNFWKRAGETKQPHPPLPLSSYAPDLIYESKIMTT